MQRLWNIPSKGISDKDELSAMLALEEIKVAVADYMMKENKMPQASSQ